MGIEQNLKSSTVTVSGVSPKPCPPPPRGSEPRPTPEHLVRRACTDKAFFATEALVQDEITLRMATCADRPLYFYPCSYCPGFHVTSSDGVAYDSPNPKARSLASKVDITDILRPEDYRKARRASMRSGRRDTGRKRRSRAMRFAEGDRKIDLLPKPRLASPEEIAAIFGSAVEHLPDTVSA